MKKTTILSICLIALISIIGLSCEKNAEELIYTEVEYGILSMDPYISSITYNDASGKPVVTSDQTEFVNGSKKLSVSGKPYTARMEVQIDNTSNIPRTYTIGILIDGEIKAIKSVDCPPSAITFADVEFVIV